MQQINESLERLDIAEPTVYRNLALFPLIDRKPAPATYITLDEGLAEGSIQVSEVNEGGSVPELALRNKGDRPVLLLDGEELVGAKQNRVLNITILVAANSTMIIPVSCVEQGRWGFRGSRDFGSAGRTLYAGGRKSKMSQVSESLRRSGVRRARQAEVWHDIEKRAVGFDVHSPTGAMADIYASQQQSLDGFDQAFSPARKQTGAVFAIDGKVNGCEVFDSDTTWLTLAPKLIGSYALDAISTEQLQAVKVPGVTSAEAFLRQVSQANATSHDALGLGRDIRLDSGQIVGGALETDGRVVHLSAFALDGDEQPDRRPEETRLWSFGRRRRNRQAH